MGESGQSARTGSSGGPVLGASSQQLEDLGLLSACESKLNTELLSQRRMVLEACAGHGQFLTTSLPSRS